MLHVRIQTAQQTKEIKKVKDCKQTTFQVKMIQLQSYTFSWLGNKNEPANVEKGERRSELEPHLNDDNTLTSLARCAHCTCELSSLEFTMYRHCYTKCDYKEIPWASSVKRKAHSPDLFLMLHIKSLSTWQFPLKISGFDTRQVDCFFPSSLPRDWQ